VGSFQEQSGNPPSAEPGGGVYTLDAASESQPGSFTIDPSALDVSYLAPHPHAAVVYAISRTPAGGRVSACTVDPDTAQLTAVDILDAGGTGPCHVSVSPDAGVLFVANYRDSTIASYVLAADGRIRSQVEVIEHTYTGPNPDRQTESHPHMVIVDPVTGLLLVPDLGGDKVVAYSFDEVTGHLQVRPDASVALPPGAGPRHLAFLPDNDAVVVNELDSTVALLVRTGESFTVADVTSILAADDASGKTSAPSAIRTSPDGSLVYVANRGPDTVATLRREPDGRSLTLISTISCGGAGPRDMIVEPDGHGLLVANQYNHVVAALPLSEAGLPQPVASSWSVPSPSSILPIA
jgi:6-phosphogluconolactonase